MKYLMYKGGNGGIRFRVYTETVTPSQMVNLHDNLYELIGEFDCLNKAKERAGALYARKPVVPNNNGFTLSNFWVMHSGNVIPNVKGSIL